MLPIASDDFISSGNDDFLTQNKSDYCNIMYVWLQTLSTRSFNILQLVSRLSETVLTVQVIAFKKFLIYKV